MAKNIERKWKRIEAVGAYFYTFFFRFIFCRKESKQLRDVVEHRHTEKERERGSCGEGRRIALNLTRIGQMLNVTNIFS